MKYLLPVAIGALAVAVPASAQVMQPADYVAAAGASDLYEEQSSQIVLETTTNPQIRSYATMMIQEHGQTTSRVTAAAARANVPVAPPVLTPLQTELIAELRAETGPARDAAYIAQQRASHNQALFVQQSYAASGTAAPLRTAAAAIVPVVRHHITMLQQF